MKHATLLTIAAALLCAAAAGAATPELQKQELDRVLATFLPPCPDPISVRAEGLPIDLGNDIRASMVRIDSENAWCDTQLLALGRGNGYSLGMPWLLNGLIGTPAEKIRQFAWNRLHLAVEPRLAMAPRKDGFIPVVVEETTEHGVVKLEGLVDPQGTIFIPGDLSPLSEGPARMRLEKLAPIVKKAPSKGGSSPAVTVYEFSDFQCPACRRATGYADKLLSEFGDRVRYVRLDLPLVGNHPWAFPAALIGRAIWNQSPEAFWTYKQQIYANQDNLNSFTIGEFGRKFAEDYGLDLAKYDAAVNSEALKNEILASISAARSLQLNGTPTFLVDGAVVIPGEGGETLFATVRKKLQP
ncbi:MAG: DsbA family protein [Thermoanaerobaculia bacterium]